MTSATVELHAVESTAQREAAHALIGEYLHWVGGIAHANYGLTFDVDAMAKSDIEDRSKFYPLAGRFYLVQYAGGYVGVGCLKRLATGLCEVQRMYVQPHVRGVGAGRQLIERLLEDAQVLGYTKVRLEVSKHLPPRTASIDRWASGRSTHTPRTA